MELRSKERSGNTTVMSIPFCIISGSFCTKIVEELTGYHQDQVTSGPKTLTTCPFPRMFAFLLAKLSRVFNWSDNIFNQT
jgi:hypothetical protein